MLKITRFERNDFQIQKILPQNNGDAMFGREQVRHIEIRLLVVLHQGSKTCSPRGNRWNAKLLFSSVPGTCRFLKLHGLHHVVGLVPAAFLTLRQDLVHIFDFY